jgi:hypothetical protein
MNQITVITGTAKNGYKIEGVVTLVGKEGEKNCWLAAATINGCAMAYSHHNQRTSAETWSVKMQEVYMAIHSK